MKIGRIKWKHPTVRLMPSNNPSYWMFYWILQDLPDSQRADAVSSLVYEASARIRDPVYGCAGAICQLQKQINELQAELAKTQAELVNIHCHQTNLVALICKELAQTPPPMSSSSLLPEHRSLDNSFNIVATPQSYQGYTSLFGDSNIWDPLWTWKRKTWDF